MNKPMDHMYFLDTIAQRDIVTLHHKESTYGGSWKKRGGAGAFMVTFRKVDRLENIATKHGYDIFKAVAEDMSGADGSALAELRDLRQYLMLIEAEMLWQADLKLRVPLDGVTPFPEQFKSGTPEDGSHHAKYDDGEV